MKTRAAPEDHGRAALAERRDRAHHVAQVVALGEARAAKRVDQVALDRAAHVLVDARDDLVAEPGLARDAVDDLDAEERVVEPLGQQTAERVGARARQARQRDARPRTLGGGGAAAALPALELDPDELVENLGQGKPPRIPSLVPPCAPFRLPRSRARAAARIARSGSRGGSRVAPGVSRMPPSRRCQPGLVHEPLLGGDAGPRRRSRAPVGCDVGPADQRVGPVGAIEVEPILRLARRRRRVEQELRHRARRGCEHAAARAAPSYGPAARSHLRAVRCGRGRSERDVPRASPSRPSPSDPLSRHRGPPRA